VLLLLQPAAVKMAGQLEQFKNRLVSKLQNTKFLKELREFDSLIKAIGECKSKSEEDRIISAEIDTLKTRLGDPKIDRSRGREYMVRLIYCEMLGHDVSWAYVKMLQFVSEPNILTKKVRAGL
jgi:AP-4 complex subunit epsilon-1